MLLAIVADTRLPWHSLGVFDAGYSMYCEEAVLCRRTAKMGRRSFFTPTATVLHIGGGSDRNKEDKLVGLLRSQRDFLGTTGPPPPKKP